MAEPEGGDDAGAYGTPAHSIPMVSGGHGAIREPEEKPGFSGIPIVPIDAEKSSERSREPIISPDLIARAEAADARLLGSRRSSRAPSIERSHEPEERPKSINAFNRAIRQLDERVEEIEVANFEAGRAASAEKRYLEKKIAKHAERLEEVVQKLAELGDTREEQVAQEFADLAVSLKEKDAVLERRSEQQRNQLDALQAGQQALQLEFMQLRAATDQKIEACARSAQADSADAKAAIVELSSALEALQAAHAHREVAAATRRPSTGRQSPRLDTLSEEGEPESAASEEESESDSQDMPPQDTPPGTEGGKSKAKTHAKTRAQTATVRGSGLTPKRIKSDLSAQARSSDGSEEGESESEEVADDDDAVSLASLTSAAQQEKLNVSFPSSKELEAYTTDLTRASIMIKMPKLKKDLSARHAAFEELFGMDDAKYRREVARNALLKAADRYVKRVLNSIIVGKNDEVFIFESREADLPEEEAKLGYATFLRITEFGCIKAGRKARAYLKEIQAKTYLRCSMSQTEAEAGCERVRADWRMLPLAMREANCVRRMLCNRVPEELKEDGARTLGMKLEDEIDDAVRKKSAEITFRYLVDTISERIGAVGGGGNVNVLTRKGSGQPCFNCGESSETKCKGFKECRQKCPTDKKKGCPCCVKVGPNAHPASKPCPLTMKTCPPLNLLLNGAGVMREELAKKYAKRHADFWKANAAAAAMMSSGASSGGEEEPKIVFMISTKRHEQIHEQGYGPLHVYAIRARRPQPNGDGTINVRFMIDTGADCAVTLAQYELSKYAKLVEQGGPTLDGVGPTPGQPERTLLFKARLADSRGESVFDLRSIDLDGGTRMDTCIVGYHYLKQMLGGGSVKILLEPELCIIKDGEVVASLMAVGHHFFIDLVLSDGDTCSAAAASSGSAAAASDGQDVPTGVSALNACKAVVRARAHDPTFLMAMRFGQDAEGIKKLEGAIDGLSIGKVSPETAVLINNEEGLRRSRHTRRSASHAVEARKQSVLPCGHTWLLDVWWSSVADSESKCEGLMHAFCKNCGWCYTALVPDGSIQTHVSFTLGIKKIEDAANHEMKVICVDATPIFAADAAKRTFERGTGLLLDCAAGDDHEVLGIGEAGMNPITRRTEAAWMRAQSADEQPPAGLMLLCRQYQTVVWNCNIASGKSANMTRYQMHLGKAPGIGTFPAYLWWTRGSVHAIGQQRGPKGFMDEARSSRERTGRLIGFRRLSDGKGVATLRADDTHQKITRNMADFDPLDEHVIATAGLPGGSAVESKLVQCEIDMLPELTPLAPLPQPTLAPTARTIVKYVMPTDEMPTVGDQLEVLWKEATGDTYSYHKAVVKKISEDDVKAVGDASEGAGKTKRLTELEYTDWQGKDKTFTHDLARDRATNAHPWAKLAPAAAEKKAADKMKNPKKKATRHSGRVAKQRILMATLEVVDEALATAKNPVKVFDGVISQVLGDYADKYTTDNFAGDLDAALKAVYLGITRGGLAEKIYDDEYDRKATAGERNAAVAKKKERVTVTVNTPSGLKREYSVPRNKVELLAAPDSVEWLIEEEAAVYQSILAMPNNRLVSVVEAKKTGQTIASLVTVRKYKIDPETGMIKKRKVRHSVDQARLMRSAKGGAKEMLESYATGTMPVGEAEMNLFLASVGPNDWLLLLDWKDAYGIGTSARGKRYVYGPDTVELTTDIGEPACIELSGCGLWGEGPAGFEFEEVKEEDMGDAGWICIKEVPSFFDGGDGHLGASIMDDLCIRCRGSPARGHELAAYLSKRSVERGGYPLVVTVIGRTGLWGGMQIERSADWMSMHVHMEGYVVATAMRWIPEYVKHGSIPAGVPTGTALRKALDELDVMDGDGKLDEEQRDFQCIVGALRWMVRRIVRIVKATHMCSCVAQRCSKGGRNAALGVLIEAYDSKREGHIYDENTGPIQFLGVVKGTVNAVKGTSVQKVDHQKLIAAGAAPKEMMGQGDATWNRGTTPKKRDVRAFALTVKGAAVLVSLKTLVGTGGSSAENEGLTLLKLSDAAMYLRIVAAKAGFDMSMPTVLLCDAESALKAAAGDSSLIRLKHTIRRAAIVKERIAVREVSIAHVPDVACAVDVLTKWVAKDKLEDMLAFLTGGSSRRTIVEAASYANAALAAICDMFEQFNEETLSPPAPDDVEWPKLPQRA